MKIKDKMYVKNTAGLTMAAFGHCIFISFTSMALPMFFTDIMFINPATVSVIFLVTRIWDAVNDPLMGSIVERSRTRWGKCRPFILYAAFPLLIITTLMFMPVSIQSNSGKFFYALTTYLLFSTVFTMLDIPLAGLKPLLFSEPQKRYKAASISTTFGSLGSLFAVDLFFAMVVVFGGGNNKIGYFITVLLLSILGFIMLLGGFFTVKEVVPVAKAHTPFLKSISITLKNKNLITAIIMQICSIGISAYGIMIPYFSKWNLADSFSFGAFSVESVLIPILSTATGVVYMIAVMATPYLLKLTTKKKMFFYMSVAGVFFNILSLTLGYRNLYLFVIIRIFAHIPPTITSMIAGYMIMDCLDYAEYKSGIRTEGSTFAFNSLVMQIANALFTSFVLLLLGLSGYNAEITEPALKIGESISNNYKEMLNSIFLIMTGLPAIGLLLQIIPMLFYKLDDKEVTEIVDELKRRRENETVTEGTNV